MSQILCFARIGSAIALGILFAATTLILPSASAQTGSQAVERAQLLRAQTTLRQNPVVDETGSDDTGAVASPNDPDLGKQAILKRAEHYRAFTFYTSAPVSYTSNVALTRSGEQGDVLFTPNVGINYAPRLTGTLFGNIGVAQQFFYYNKFHELDFASFDIRVGLVYALPRLHNLLLRADYGYNRLTQSNSFDAFFSSHSLNLGAELPFRIGRAQQISIGTDLSLLLDSDPEEPGRNDFSLFAAYSVNMTRRLTLSALARVALRDYVEIDRTDVSATLALSANYRFTPWLSLNATSTLATSNSDRDVFDYDVANIGGAVALAFKF